MNLLTILGAVVVAIAVLLFSVLAAAMKRELNEFSRHESLSFIRLSLVGAFAVLLSQSLSPLSWSWWVETLTALGSTGLLLIFTQVFAKAYGLSKFGQFLAKALKPLVRSIDIAFTPIASKAEPAPEEFEQEFIESVEDFGETVIREIMVPRIDMETVASDTKLEATLKDFMSSGFSRLPVRGKNIDDLVGVLYLKDVARAFTDNPKSLQELTAGKLARKPMLVPDSKPVDDLLKQMQISATHVAIVIDEYGGVAGLVTMEDVIEELVGEINDEYDRERPDIEELGPGSYRVSAKSSLFEFGEHIGLDLEDEDIDSVGGLLTKLLGRLPRGGDQAHQSGVTLLAERFEGRDRRLVTVLVTVDPEVLAMKDTQ
jgi:CBS domain containing-hemolysin-like protein